MNYIFEVTLAGQVVCLAVAFILPYLMAKDDAIEIELNGSFDSLKANWHQVSAIMRFTIFTALGTLSLLPAALILDLWIQAFTAFVSYGFLAISLHWYIFDRKLNQLRGLNTDYIGINAEIDKLIHKEQTVLKLISLAVSAFCYLGTIYFLLF